MRRAVVLAGLLAWAMPAEAQITGYASVTWDMFPDVSGAPGAQRVGEVRARVVAERRDRLGEHVRVVLSGAVDGLIGHRVAADGRAGVERDAIVQPLELHAEAAWSRVDVRVGMSRIVWGRLDEFQPTDVVNPIDLTRFLFEGRSEARLPVGVARVRLFLPKSSALEAVLVPVFRASRFDQLGEATSPFDLRPAGVFRRREPPERNTASMQGGARLTTTTRRVDWGVSVYRGFRSFPTSTLDLASATVTSLAVPTVFETFPRFTMVGADFETVRGAWGLRGEVAAFVDDELQSVRGARGVPGRSVEAGIGVDRRAGEYRLAANLLWSWRGVDTSDPVGRLFDGDPEVEGTDGVLVVAADRSFARETRTLRAFSAYDPGDGTLFSRVIGAVSVAANVWVEGSAGLFAGSAPDTLGRLTNRDFVSTRLKVSF